MLVHQRWLKNWQFDHRRSAPSPKPSEKSRKSGQTGSDRFSRRGKGDKGGKLGGPEGQGPAESNQSRNQKPSDPAQFLHTKSELEAMVNGEWWMNG